MLQRYMLVADCHAAISGKRFGYSNRTTCSAASTAPGRPRTKSMDAHRPTHLTEVHERENSNEAYSAQEKSFCFRVSDSVKLTLHRGDITQWFVNGETDAIVNAANPRMLGGGGVDGAIHRTAGPKLKQACKRFPEVSSGSGVRCPTGEARVTPGFDLRVSCVIHTVGPIYYHHENREELLRNAYRNSLKAAVDNGKKYIAFPAISCGAYGYPVKEAAMESLALVKEASGGLSEIHFVLFEENTFSAWLQEAQTVFQKL